MTNLVSRCREWNNDEKWSSQVRKSGEMSKTSTGKLVSDKLVIDIDMDSATKSTKVELYSEVIL